MNLALKEQKKKKGRAVVISMNMKTVSLKKQTMLMKKVKPFQRPQRQYMSMTTVVISFVTNAGLYAVEAIILAPAQLKQGP